MSECIIPHKSLIDLGCTVINVDDFELATIHKGTDNNYVTLHFKNGHTHNVTEDVLVQLKPYCYQSKISDSVYLEAGSK